MTTNQIDNQGLTVNPVKVPKTCTVELDKLTTIFNLKMTLTIADYSYLFPVIENTLTGVMILDLKGYCVFCNPAFESLVGYSQSDLYQHHYSHYLHHDDQEGDRILFKNLISGEQTAYQREQRYLHYNQESVWMTFSFSLIYNHQGKPHFILLLLHDIQGHKETTQNLQLLLQNQDCQLKQIHQQLSQQINHDPLTGLINRYEFKKRLEYLLNHLISGDNEEIFDHTLLYLDLDHFKRINDNYGQIAGDELLRKVSSLLKHRCRQTDTLGRLGGNQFAILLNQCSLSQAEEVAKKILTRIQELSFTWDNELISISASIGLISLSEKVQSVDELMGLADTACLVAKERGRSRIQIYSRQDQSVQKHQRYTYWVKEIENAIRYDYFKLYYQPILSLNNSQEHHYEIFLRLVDERGKIFTPSQFLPAAERYNLMLELDQWVISHFFSHICSLLYYQPTPICYDYLTYNLNLSGETINNENFLDFIKYQFSLYQIPHQLICFEITETVAVENLSQAQRLIYEIKNMGCKIALDDFGSGMSSFRYLKHLPVDYLKIDGSLVKDIDHDSIDCTMVSAIHQMSHVMGIKTVAEYVANEKVLAKIKEIGIDYAQGFAIAYPQPIHPHLILAENSIA